MNIVEQIENEYRRRKNYGVQFSFEPEAYNSKVGERIRFGENTSAMQCGSFYNYQDIILDGNIVGYLEEIQSGRLLDPMTVSFCIPIADCSEQELWDYMADKYKDNPHLHDADEVLELRFATLTQMLNHLKVS